MNQNNNNNNSSSNNNSKNGDKEKNEPEGVGEIAKGTSHGQARASGLVESQPGDIEEGMASTRSRRIVVRIPEGARGIPHSGRATEELAAAMKGGIYQSNYM